MSHKILILESAVSNSWTTDFVRSSNVAGLCFEIKSWSWATCDRLRSWSPGLIVANAVNDSRPLLPFLRMVRESNIGAGTLAIVPESLPEELFSGAVQIADDFLVWPAESVEFKLRVERLLGPSEIDRSALDVSAELGQLVGEDPSFLHLLQQVPVFARAGVPVLITGETGTGKELFAHALHSLSTVRNGPFIPVDCGAIPEHLLENELFGHARGAYTDARTEQKGLVALAHGGTLFLDEVDALSLACQSKLLRLLQERTYRPLGADQFQLADVRVIAATNRDLPKCIEEKAFRADLFYRLNVLRLHLVPLRKRPRDIAILARHFVQQLNGPGSRKSLSAASLAKLESYDWPGNVRELYNIIQSAVVCTPGSVILPEALCILSRKGPTMEGTNFRSARAHAIQVFERNYVEVLLSKHSGNITQSAREAGKDRRAFGRLVKKYVVNG